MFYDDSSFLMRSNQRSFCFPLVCLRLYRAQRETSSLEVFVHAYDIHDQAQWLFGVCLDFCGIPELYSSRLNLILNSPLSCRSHILDYRKTLAVEIVDSNIISITCKSPLRLLMRMTFFRNRDVQLGHHVDGVLYVGFQSSRGLAFKTLKN